MGELLLRFLIGGLAVCIFAIIGDLFKPKNFAGLFGAAPSVALATLALTAGKHGGPYAAVEARSMAFAAVALLVYALLGALLVKRLKWQAMAAMCVALPLWFAVAFAIYFGGLQPHL